MQLWKASKVAKLFQGKGNHILLTARQCDSKNQIFSLNIFNYDFETYYKKNKINDDKDNKNKDYYILASQVFQIENLFMVHSSVIHA